MSTAPLVLRLYDRQDRSLAHELVLPPAGLEDVLRHLQLTHDDLPPHVLVDLEPAEVEWLNAQGALAIDPARFHVQLGRGFLDDGLPYRLHTGRELRMMLAGVKPLAVFSDVLDDDPSPWCFPEDVFEPHVQAGTFARREFVELQDDGHGGQRRIRVLLYALAAEAWRIDAFILLGQCAALHGWNAALTRMQGALLGYAHWQNEAYLCRASATRLDGTPATPASGGWHAFPVDPRSPGYD